MNIKTDNNNSAFTLVELAIVLIIIGLITGGVVGAQSLIESSKIKDQISQIIELNTSTNAFVMEYGYLPGDILRDEADAYGFSRSKYNDWNYNQNGNKKIDMYYGHACYPAASLACNRSVLGEPELFFIHLSEANLIKEDIPRSGDRLPGEGLLATRLDDKKIVTTISGFNKNYIT